MDQILTEAQLIKHYIAIHDVLPSITAVKKLNKIKDSHKSLLSANAELSFEIMVRKRYEGFLKSVARSGEILEERKDFEWFKNSSEAFLPYKTLEESK